MITKSLGGKKKKEKRKRKNPTTQPSLVMGF
jgi:hypothetical protein